MYLYDYHMHSINSHDGKNTISDMCARAIVSGLKEIAVTDHFEPMPGYENCLEYKPEVYFLDILKARFVYGTEVKIKCAVELGQPHHFPGPSQRLIDSHPYDYVLSSAHKMKDGTDFSEIAYTDENTSHYCIRYLDELQALAEWNEFDCVAHLDLVKRYAANSGVKADLSIYRERLEEILTTIIRNGKGIEVNTSGLRQATNECLPDLDIISLYRQLGGEIITVGSDAHCTDDVGKGIRNAVEIIRLAGFDFMTVYTKRQPSMIKISEKSSVFQFSSVPA